MKTYEINPLHKPKPYMTVRLNDRKPDMIDIRCPKYRFTTTFDARAGVELIMAINALCRQAGHPYLPGIQDE